MGVKKMMLKRMTFPPLLLLWALVPILDPIPLFPSGSFQIADFVMVLVFFLVTLRFGIRIPNRVMSVVVSFALFTVYVFSVNFIWAIKLGEVSLSHRESTFISSFYYLFNFISLLAIVGLYAKYREQFLKVTLYSFIVSIFLQIFLLPISLTIGRGLLRDKLFFNNPNQLGYYVLIALVVFALGEKYIKFPSWLRIGYYVACFLLSSFALSKAALVGIILLLLLLLVKTPTHVVLVVITFFGLIAVSQGTAEQFDKITSRIAKIGTDKDDNLVNRGYDRILTYPEYWILGAGEGDFYRFSLLSDKVIELHSGFGTLFFCYGIVGSLLFLLGVFFTIMCYGRILALYLLPVFFFCLTHQGFRPTIFWILFAFALGSAVQFRTRSRNPVLKGYYEPA
jgi:hypothetical protein